MESRILRLNFLIGLGPGAKSDQSCNFAVATDQLRFKPWTHFISGFFSVCPSNLGADAELLAREPKCQNFIVAYQENAYQAPTDRRVVGTNVADADVFAEREANRNFANINL